MRTSALRLIGALALGASALVPLSSSAAPPDPTCSWLAKTEPDTVNVAFPDTNATYWSHPYVAAPGTELVVHGTYPRARYFSFNIYQPSGVPLDSIYDQQIRPDSGSQNPFAGGSPRASRQSWTVRVSFTAKPARPARNTIYAGKQAVGGPNPGGLLMLRVYTPIDPRSPQGGVPLPRVTTQTTTGQVLQTGTACSTDAPATGGVGTSTLNASSWPETPTVGNGTISWSKAFSNKGFGFFGNQQNAYLTAAINRSYGDLVVIRTRPPRFPDTARGHYPGSRDQVRYWSFCQNSNSTRVNACTADAQTAVGKDGYVTIVISDLARRPSNATARNGVTWLPWGAADATGRVIYRHMAPSAGFRQSIQSIDQTEDPQRVMGAYYPEARYCSRSGFERLGWRGCLEK
jgi:hypothetical protein